MTASVEMEHSSQDGNGILRNGRLLLLVMVLCTGVFCARAPADVAAMDGSALLASLSRTPAANLKAAAVKAVKTYPSEARALALDLIFYRWAAASLEIDPGIDGLDDIAGALVAASSDRAIIWTASELGPRAWGARPLPTDDTDETVKSLKEARYALRSALGYASSSPTKSIESLKACEETLHKLRLELSAAFLDTRLGDKHLYTTRRYREAESFYDRARPILSSYRLRPQLARLYQDLGRLNEEAGLYDTAYESYGHSAQEWLGAGRGDLAGQQYVNAGLALSKLGKERGFSTMLNGLDISRNFAGTKAGNYETHARLLLQVASYCVARGQYEEAQKLLSEPDLKNKLGESLLRADVLLKLASAWRATGPESKSNEALTERKRILSSLAQKGQDAMDKLARGSVPADEQLPLLLSAETGASANGGLEKYQQAVNLLTPVAAVYDTLHRDEDRIRAMRSLAEYQDELGDHASAMTSRTQAAQLARGTGRFSLAIEILRDVQRIAQSAGDIDTQSEALYEARQVAEISNDLRATADLLFDRAVLLESQRKFTDAVEDLEAAVNIYANQIGDLWAAANGTAKLAEVRVHLEQTTEAIQALSGILTRIEQWAENEGIDPGLESGHSDTLVDLYLQLVALEVAEGRNDDATEHLRTAKQYTWYDRLANLLKATGDQKIIAVLSRVPQPPVVAQVPKGQPQKIASGWARVLMNPVFSRLSSSSGRNAGRMMIDAVDIYSERNKLPANLAIVEYWLDDSDVYVLVAGKTTASVWQINGISERVTSAVQEFRKAVQGLEKSVSAGMPLPPVKWSDAKLKSWTDPKVTLMLDPLYRLEEMLVQPIKEDFPKAPAVSIVFALPDKLAGVPFHALPREVKSPAGTVRFLLQDYTISYIARGKLSDLVTPSAGPIIPKKENVAVFPNPEVAGAASEAREIRKHFPNSKVVNGATVDKFVRECASAGIVHIATHHKPDSDPSRIAIALNGRPDSTIRFADLTRISNPGLHLLVLSACDSIGATDAEATTTTHIAEAFERVAGFPTFIGGLWKVSDRSSTVLMSEFYRLLAKNGHKAESLRLAQQSMLKSASGQFAHPYYWASFALYGDPR